MHDDKVMAALAAMRRASAHHLLSSAEQAKLLAVAEAALAARKRDHAERRWLIVSGRLGDDAEHFADDWLAEDAALDAALAALVEP